MTLLQKPNALPIHNIKKINETLDKMSTKAIPSNSFEMKEKLSSNASIMLMTVASGDNVTLDSVMNSGHKLKETPSLVPCCEGKELQINEDLVKSGLSAISVKHDGLTHCLSVSHAWDRLQVPPGLMKHRNSFRSLHRPDLKRVPYLRRMAPDDLETLFRGYADVPTRCQGNTDTREEVARVMSTTEDPQNSDRGTKNSDKVLLDVVDANLAALHPIPETRSGAEDVPAGMRLHCARARLYTSVLAGARAGDQLDNQSPNEDLLNTMMAAVDPDIEDDDQLNEELQVILPPRYEEILPGSSVTTTCTTDTCSSTYDR